MNISRKIQNVGEDHQQGESKFQGIFKKKIWFTLMNLLQLTSKLMNLRDETGPVCGAERTHRLSVLSVLHQEHKHNIYFKMLDKKNLYFLKINRRGNCPV